jgi:hypothetical protein
LVRILDGIDTMAARNINIEERVSIREYALMIGVDEKTVRKARDAGLLQNGYDQVKKKVIPDLADQAWGSAQKVTRRKPGVSKIKTIGRLNGDFGNGDNDEELSEIEWLNQEEIRTGSLLENIKITSSMATADAMRRREIIALALDKKKLEEAEGILVRREMVEKALFLLGSELRKALLDIPARTAREVMAATTEIQAINLLTDEITHVLNTYGQLKENTFTAE